MSALSVPISEAGARGDRAPIRHDYRTAVAATWHTQARGHAVVAAPASPRRVSATVCNFMGPTQIPTSVDPM